MSAPALEHLLARLYTDAELRERFLLAPERVARECGLDPSDAARMAQIDLQDLTLAAASYEHKRAQYARPGQPRSLLRRWRRFFHAMASR